LNSVQSEFVGWADPGESRRKPIKFHNETARR
jgi:hypothetical protein